jgi:sigma-B regulation protein RsbU (phosphoserine phosphatase)
VPLATLVLVAAGALAAQLLLQRWVVRPVVGIRSAALDVRSGQFDVHVPVAGAREVAELGEAVRDMRDTIVHQLDDAIRSRQALEQDALVVVELRAHLGPYVGDLGSGWSAAAELRPAEGLVAGDCYDLVRLSPSRLGCLVVDIAGHGGAAGLLALRSKEQLRAALAAGLTPGEAVGNVAEQLTGLRDGMFLTAFVGVVDLDDGRCWYTNAGHPPPMLVTDNDLLELSPTGPLVGPIRATWRTDQTVIDPGAKLLVYTDGLTEARNAGGTMLGEARLAEALRGEACEEARVVLKQCFAELEMFAPARLHDDVTVVVLCRTEGPEVPAAPVPTAELAPASR